MKKAILTITISIAISILILTVMSLSIVILPPKVYADATSYSIGDTGPAGGLIFYVDGSNYLEAAPSDQESFTFSNIRNKAIGSTGTAIGTGQANTDAIIAQTGHTTSAAMVCDDLVLGGYNDWFLPSRDELDLMYTNLYLSGLGDFSSYWYWSSSEYNHRRAYDRRFIEGTTIDSSGRKRVTNRVRAIRAFSITTEVTTEESAWTRTMPMTCWQVFINEDNMFEFIFWYLYKDNNWVRIYDMEGNMVYEVDMPINDPHIIVDLPDGMYTVKTFWLDQEKPNQEFLIGKP